MNKNNINQESAEVEQPEVDSTPEFYLDENGTLVWKEAEDALREEQESEEESEEQPEETQEEESEETTTEEEETSEEEADDPNKQESEETMVTVPINGEEVEVPLSELARGYMRQQDYTRKTQELANQRKALQNPLYGATQQPAQPAPTRQQQPDLIALAKRMATQKLGLQSEEELSEVNLEHSLVVFSELQALQQQQAAMVNKQYALDNMERELAAEDPAYNEILLRFKNKIPDMPVGEYTKLQRAYDRGDTATIKEYYEKERKEFYAEKVKTKTKPSPKVPKLEKAGSTPITKPTTKKKVDFRELGHMKPEQKAQLLMDMGIV